MESGVSASDCGCSGSRRERRPTLRLDEGGMLGLGGSGGRVWRRGAASAGVSGYLFAKLDRDVGRRCQLARAGGGFFQLWQNGRPTQTRRGRLTTATATTRHGLAAGSGLGGGQRRAAGAMATGRAGGLGAALVAVVAVVVGAGSDGGGEEGGRTSFVGAGLFVFTTNTRRNGRWGSAAQRVRLRARGDGQRSAVKGRNAYRSEVYRTTAVAGRN